MKIFFYIIFFLTLAACTKSAKPSPGTIEDVFKSPLIVGASLSANHQGIKSPGRLIASQLGFENNILQVAQPGGRSKFILASVNEQSLVGKSVVVAMDLFFWDSVDGLCDEASARAKRFIEMVAEAKVPLVIGNIPPLRQNLGQPCMKRLNETIRETCKTAPLCYELKLNEIYTEVAKAGGAKIKEQFYSEADLLPDGLHLSSAGVDMMAGEIKKLLRF